MTETPAVSNRPSSGSLSGAQIAQAAGVVVAGFVLARVIGLAQDMILAAIYGGSATYDAYLTANRPPSTIFAVVAGGALASAFIPEFVGFFVRGEEDRAWRMTSSVVNAFLLLMTALCALGAVFAEPLVRYVLAPGFSS